MACDNSLRGLSKVIYVGHLFFNVWLWFLGESTWEKGCPCLCKFPSQNKICKDNFLPFSPHFSLYAKEEWRESLSLSNPLSLKCSHTHRRKKLWNSNSKFCLVKESLTDRINVTLGQIYPKICQANIKEYISTKLGLPHSILANFWFYTCLTVAFGCLINTQHEKSS